MEGRVGFVVGCQLLLFTLAIGEQDPDAGVCACDLTSYQCDVNCCCDPDCQGDALAALRKSFDCKADGIPDNTQAKCYSKSWVHRVNARTDLWVLADDMSGLLCVAVDNNVVEGVFYTNQATVPTSKLDQVRAVQRVVSFADRLSKAPSPPSNDRGYRVGDELKIHRRLTENGGQVVTIEGANALSQAGIVEIVESLPLRTPGVLGTCSPDPGQSVRFLSDVEPVSCWLQPVDLRSACSTTLRPSFVLNWLMRKIHLNSVAKCLEDRCLEPDLNASCPVEIVKSTGEVETSPCSSGSPAGTTRLVEDASGCTCYGALRDLRYTFYYRPDASQNNAVGISKIEVRMTLQDVQSAQCEAAAARQGSEVRFVEVVSEPSLVHARSGNPGYQFGLPLLVATCKQYDSTNTRCEQYEETPDTPSFATVPGVMPDGLCAYKTDSGKTRPMGINFGEDAVFGCVLRLTRLELKSLCQSSAGGSGVGFAEMLQILSFGQLGGRWTAVGSYGRVRSDADWLEVTAQPTTEILSFDDGDLSRASTSTCSGAVVGVNLEVLYSPFGEVHNPQLRIVAARQSHKLGSLRYTRSDINEKQPFEFTYTVSFLRLDDGGDTIARVPPRPQVPLWLPHDLFYPFGLSSSARRAARPWLARSGQLLALHLQVLVYASIGSMAAWQFSPR
eukprot:TRINITY_DN80265_c0_g1_i1.p1 TRINITY_DN80265_c0_g1~~TRINITY_DN80265_c0_g1_i1.p1  ORF type:complete len:672 (-),score=85.63 TRINITY_DN80265_c0_g1_i1:177-2192(-)